MLGRSAGVPFSFSPHDGYIGNIHTHGGPSLLHETSLEMSSWVYFEVYVSSQVDSEDKPVQMPNSQASSLIVKLPSLMPVEKISLRLISFLSLVSCLSLYRWSLL